MFSSSNGLTNDEIQKLKNETDFKSKSIKKCHKKFLALDKDKKNYVSITDIVNIPEVENNPLRYLIAQNMSKDDEKISFESFIKVIDNFKNNKLSGQYEFIYNIFDFDKDGKISNEDMLVNFKLLVGNSLNEEQIMDIVDRTIKEYSSDGKYINYNDFVKILNES